jgi:hypothetical protein
LDKDERTTDVGLYHFARSYRAAADYLDPGPPKSETTHPDAPRDFLYAHAIELYLKAFLRTQGMSVDELKKIGHDIPTLAQLVARYGVPIEPQIGFVLELLNKDNVFGARYIVTGYYQRATTEGLRLAAERLHIIARTALRDLGRIRGD